MTDASGNWNIFQSNGPVVEITVNQNGNNLSGTAAITSGGTGQGDILTESIVQNQFILLVIDWRKSFNAVGEYHGWFGLNGRMIGIGFDRINPQSQTFFNSDREFHVTPD